MNAEQLKPVVEALLMVSETPLSLERLAKLVVVEDGTAPDREALREVLAELARDYDGRGVELTEVASGWRFRTRSEVAGHVGRLWEERKPRYSRAFLETLAIIAYRQPITRGEIEHIRGVAVSSNIMRQLLEREWIKVVGHRDVPGRPSVFATTRAFLDYFGLSSLDQLPTLADLKDIDDINADLFAGEDAGGTASGESDEADEADEADETDETDDEDDAAGERVAPVSRGAGNDDEAPPAPHG